jgi:trans-aconitate methyltransferase
MKQRDRDCLVAFYESRHAELGDNIRSLGWNTEADQNLRFDVLCDIADLSGESVCDVGCGFGDLRIHLNRRFTDVAYSGVDVTPAFVKTARSNHAGVPFYCVDIVEETFDRRADYFLLSGALNFRVDDNWAHTTAMLTRMFALANKGVAVNFLTTLVNFQRPVNYHHDPMQTFAFARTLTRWVTIRHDYPLWEFTLYLYHDPR